MSLTDEPLDSPPRVPAAVAAPVAAAATSRGGLAAPPGGWGASAVADAAPSYDEIVASGPATAVSPQARAVRVCAATRRVIADVARARMSCPAQLPPPSYADSVYFDRAEITPQEEGTGSASAALADEAGGTLTVAVTSPEKRSDASSALGRLAGKKYVAFAVAYRAEGLAAFAAAPAGAPRRRFRDFVGLAARLVRPSPMPRGRDAVACGADISPLQAVSPRGYFIPPRPEKKLEGQLDASPEFIEERRDALEKWMRQCVPLLQAAVLFALCSRTLRCALVRPGLLRTLRFAWRPPPSRF